MKQKLEIIVTVEVDTDHWMFDREQKESRLWESIEKTLPLYVAKAQGTKCIKKDRATVTHFEYGDPV